MSHYFNKWGGPTPIPCTQHSSITFHPTALIKTIIEGLTRTPENPIEAMAILNAADLLATKRISYSESITD